MGRTLFDSVPCDIPTVADAVAKHWGCTLGERVKASQNHTFAATDKDGNAVMVRATPDPRREQRRRIEDELHVCLLACLGVYVSVCVCVCVYE